MSCAGKTFFSQKLKEHHYYCFDALFEWHIIETFNLNPNKNLEKIKHICKDEKYVLDGWCLSDKDGLYLPVDAKVYVIYSTYENIINQYRTPFEYRDQFLLMYKKWYSIDYNKINARYFFNQGVFTETNFSDYYSITKI